MLLSSQDYSHSPPAWKTVLGGGGGQGEGGSTGSSSRLGSSYLGPSSSWVQTCCRLRQAPPMEALLLPTLPLSHPVGIWATPASSPFPPHLSLTWAWRTAFLGSPCFPALGLGTHRVDRKERGSRGWQVCAKPQFCHLLPGSSQARDSTSLSPVSSCVNA